MSRAVATFCGALAACYLLGAAAEAVAAAPSEPLGRAKREHLRASADAYARALRQLAAGDRRAAMATLDAGESRAVLALGAEAVPLLERAESSVLADLDAGEWGCVLPAILLHLELSREYARGRRHVLALHATRMTLDLASAYARKLAAPEAAREAAAAVASLAGHLQAVGALSSAERLFHQALALAGDDAAALLGLATIYEKRGLFDEAVPPLEAFVAARPAHAEGRLRLALNRHRSGRDGEARCALERLAAGPGSDWVTLLATQELARLEMDGKRLDRAARVLRRGLGRWPGHPTLTLQLAWVLDAGGRPLESQRLVAGLDLAAEPEPAGERSRYNRWPTEELEAGRRDLAASAAARLPDLGRWLASREEAR